MIDKAIDKARLKEAINELIADGIVALLDEDRVLPADRIDVRGPCPMLPLGDDFRLPPEVAPGVLAFLHERGDTTVCDVVISMQPGAGRVGSWIDSLPKERTVVFLDVLSSKLNGMLTRRGYTPVSIEFDDGATSGMVRKAT